MYSLYIVQAKFESASMSPTKCQCICACVYTFVHIWCMHQTLKWHPLCISFCVLYTIHGIRIYTLTQWVSASGFFFAFSIFNLNLNRVKNLSTILRSMFYIVIYLRFANGKRTKPMRDTEKNHLYTDSVVRNHIQEFELKMQLHVFSAYCFIINWAFSLISLKKENLFSIFLQ